MSHNNKHNSGRSQTSQTCSDESITTVCQVYNQAYGWPPTLLRAEHRGGRHDSRWCFRGGVHTRWCRAGWCMSYTWVFAKPSYHNNQCRRCSTGESVQTIWLVHMKKQCRQILNMTEVLISDDVKMMCEETLKHQLQSTLLHKMSSLLLMRMLYIDLQG